MTKQIKEEIRSELIKFCTKMGSQNKAAKALGVSAAIISRIVNYEWSLIADEMWIAVANGCGYSFNEWNIVETRDFQILQGLMEEAQVNGLAIAVCGDAGSGKTISIKQYCKSNSTAFMICCNEFWNRKQFLEELLSKMGLGSSSNNIYDMMDTVVKKLKVMDSPIIILDEADKLSDNVLYFFITLYNSLEDDGGNLKCGLMMCATNFLEKRLKRGLAYNKKGYKEIFSRIGRKCVPLTGVNANDIAQICVANGITDTPTVKEIIKSSEKDLRRVKRAIHSHKINQ